MTYVVIIISLAIFVFCLNITVQFLRIEKLLSEISIIIEEKVSRMFSSGRH